MAATPAQAAAEVEAATTPLLEWNVISVKPTQSCATGSGMQVATDGVHVFCLPLRALIQIAWAINEGSRVLGAPAWTNETMYNIDAKVAGEDVATFGKQGVGQRNRMLQQLLQDRFKLRAHLESRELPIYELVVAKGGPKLKEATQGRGCNIHVNAARQRRDRFDLDAASFSALDAGAGAG
jgi:uncharacterized protein (TIGR03435 family)